MCLIYLFADVTGYAYDMLNALGIVVLVLLWENPFLLSYSGFVFSVMAVIAIGPELARAILQKKAFADAEREVKHCRKHGIEIIASTDAQYPALLRETADYPHVIF